MKEKLTKTISLFLNNEKRKKHSQKSIKMQKEAMNVLKKWQKENNLENLNTEEFISAHFTKFEKNLFEKYSSKDRKIYLKITANLLKFYEKKVLKKEQENNIQKIVNHYFHTKGYSLEDIKDSARKKKIIYSRHTRPAKELIELTGSTKKAIKAIDIVSEWAKSRKLDYAIETVFKKWPEIKNLKPKEKKKTPYFRNDPMIWSKNKNKWYVINKSGDWLEFAGEEEEIVWKEEE